MSILKLTFPTKTIVFFIYLARLIGLLTASTSEIPFAVGFLKVVRMTVINIAAAIVVVVVINFVGCTASLFFEISSISF